MTPHQPSACTTRPSLSELYPRASQHSLWTHVCMKTIWLSWGVFKVRHELQLDVAGPGNWHSAQPTSIRSIFVFYLYPSSPTKLQNRSPPASLLPLNRPLENPCNNGEFPRAPRPPARTRRPFTPRTDLSSLTSNAPLRPVPLPPLLALPTHFPSPDHTVRMLFGELGEKKRTRSLYESIP